MNLNIKKQLIADKQYAEMYWQRVQDEIALGVINRDKIAKAMALCNEVDQNIIKYGFNELLC